MHVIKCVPFIDMMYPLHFILLLACFPQSWQLPKICLEIRYIEANSSRNWTATCVPYPLPDLFWDLFQYDFGAGVAYINDQSDIRPLLVNKQQGGGKKHS